MDQQIKRLIYIPETCLRLAILCFVLKMEKLVKGSRATNHHVWLCLVPIDFAYWGNTEIDYIAEHEVQPRLQQREMVRHYYNGEGQRRFTGGRHLKASQAYPAGCLYFICCGKNPSRKFTLTSLWAPLWDQLSPQVFDLSPNKDHEHKCVCLNNTTYRVPL